MGPAPAQNLLWGAQLLAAALLSSCSQPGRSGEGLLAVPADCTIGVLLANQSVSDSRPSGYCIAGNYFTGASFRLSRLNLFGVEPDQDLTDKLVLVRARQHKDLAAKLVHRGPCPEEEPFPVQFRADWLADEGGYENTQVQLTGATYLQAMAKPRAIDLVTVRLPQPKVDDGRKSGARPAASDPVRLEVHNPFDKALSGLELILHYEGGPGKPMPHYEVQQLDLRPGQILRREVPLNIEMPTGEEGQTSWWRFKSATLGGRAGGCTFLPDTPRRGI